MRLPLPLLAAALLAGCGQASPDPAANSVALGNELTLDLPPPLDVPETPGEQPEAPPPSPPEREKEPPADQPEASPTSLVAAPPPIAIEGLAGYITRAGFECDEVTATSRLEDAQGRPAGIFKFDCATGGSYRGTMRRGHLYFRPWTGQPGAGG